MGARSLLPHFLATLYGLAIVYASLQPFANWMAPVPGSPYLPRSRPGRRAGCATTSSPTASPTSRSDSSSGWSRAGARRPIRSRWPSASAPPVARDGNAADVPADARRERRGPPRQHGGSGARRRPRRWPSRARRARRARSPSARDRWFLPGIAGDLGLALLAIWLAVQANPGIPLFATMYDSAARPFAEPAPDDVAATLVECVHSAFQLLGVGLFVALLVRERRHVAGAVLLLIGAAAIIKGVAATVLLNPAAGEHWLTPAVALGVAVGSLVLALAIRLPRSAQVTLAAIALAVVVARDAVRAGPPVRARAGRALQRTLWPPAQLQRPHSHRAAAVAGGRQRVPVRAGRASRLGRIRAEADASAARDSPRVRASARSTAAMTVDSGNCRRQSEKLATCWSQPSRMQGTHAPTPWTSSTLPHRLRAHPAPRRRRAGELARPRSPLHGIGRAVQARR